MSKIRLLNDRLINQIAAGEVIDRAESIVRELVDNSIDAEATSIKIYIENGGRTLIKVIDNGIGMNKDDALMSLQRHATSKLSGNKLKSINTLGFRGEAIPSIASVTKFNLKTSESDGEGVEIDISGGKILEVLDASFQKGTDITIRKLFFNVPARKKFLKSSKFEETKIKSWVKRSAITNPNVHYQLYIDNSEVLNMFPVKEPLERARSLFIESLEEIDFKYSDISVKGLVTHPQFAKTSNSNLITFVNGRLINSKDINKAVKDGFDSTLKAKEYPAGVILLQVAPEFIDINVHPQKHEVRFNNMSDIYTAVREGVRDAVYRFSKPVAGVVNQSYFLSGSNFQKQVVQEKDKNDLVYKKEKLNLESKAVVNENIESKNIKTKNLETNNIISFDNKDNSLASKSENQNDQNIDSQNIDYENKDITNTKNLARDADKFYFSNLKYIGQSHKCFLFCEYESELFVVDMHAAHERYNYNLIRNSIFHNKVKTHQLLIPINVKLNFKAFNNCIDNLDTFKKFGIDIDTFGEDTIIVRGVPYVLQKGNIIKAIEEISEIEILESADNVFKEIIDKVSARLACHSSIRAGKEMHKQEVYALFEQLDKTEFSAACPHGRPVIVKFSKSQIETWFGRDK